MREKINLAYDLLLAQETTGSAFCISNALITPSSPNYFTWWFNIFGSLGLLYLEFVSIITSKMATNQMEKVIIVSIIACKK